MESNLQEDTESEEEEVEIASSIEGRSQQSPSDEGEDFVNTKSGGVPTEYIIQIPSTACRQDLIDLKSYLEEVTPGSIQVFINIQGQQKDTKIAVGDILAVEKWTKARGWKKK